MTCPVACEVTGDCVRAGACDPVFDCPLCDEPKPVAEKVEHGDDEHCIADCSRCDRCLEASDQPLWWED